MELLEEEGPENGRYAIAYKFPDGMIRVAKYYREDGKLVGILETQRAGIKLRVKNLEFENGVPIYRDMNSTSCERLFRPETIDDKLKTFAPEFKEIFEANRNLMVALPTHFTAISNHFKQ